MLGRTASSPEASRGTGGLLSRRVRRSLHVAWSWGWPFAILGAMLWGLAWFVGWLYACLVIGGLCAITLSDRVSRTVAMLTAVTWIAVDLLWRANLLCPALNWLFGWNGDCGRPTGFSNW